MAEADFSTIKDSLRFAVEHGPDGLKTLDLLGKKSIDLTEDECASLAELLTADAQGLNQRSLSDFSGSGVCLALDTKRYKSFEAHAW